MAIQFLSCAELDRLDSFPQEIAADQLAAYFRLDGEELAFVREQRGAASQLGSALQLCALRWLGFVPAGLVDAPVDAIDLSGLPARRARAGDLRLRGAGAHRPRPSRASA